MRASDMCMEWQVARLALVRYLCEHGADVNAHGPVRGILLCLICIWAEATPASAAAATASAAAAAAAAAAAVMDSSIEWGVNHLLLLQCYRWSAAHICAVYNYVGVLHCLYEHGADPERDAGVRVLYLHCTSRAARCLPQLHDTARSTE